MFFIEVILEDNRKVFLNISEIIAVEAHINKVGCNIIQNNCHWECVTSYQAVIGAIENWKRVD